MTACAACGNNPIKFKDSIFIVNPEPCAVWPSRWFCIGRPDFAAYIETFQRRKEKSSVE
jgi:hypothetical protein